MQDNSLLNRVASLEKRVAELEARITSSSSSLQSDPEKKVILTDSIIKKKFSITFKTKKHTYYLNNGITGFDEHKSTIAMQLEKMRKFPESAEIYITYEPGARIGSLTIEQIDEFFDNQRRILVVLVHGKNDGIIGFHKNYIRVRTRNLLFDESDKFEKIDGCMNVSPAKINFY